MQALALTSRLSTATRRKLVAAVFTLTMAFSATVGEATAATYTIYASHPGLALCSRQFGYVEIYTKWPSAASIPSQNTVLTSQLLTKDSTGAYTKVVATVRVNGYLSVWQPSTRYYSDAWYSVANGSRQSSDLFFSVPDYNYFYYIMRFKIQGSSGVPRTVYSNPMTCPAGL